MLTAGLLAGGLLAILQLTQDSRGLQPSCRKSSALSVLELSAPASSPSVVVWGGKGPHGADDMLDGLFAFDLEARKWQAVQGNVLAAASTRQLQQPATTSQQHAPSSLPAFNLTRSGLPSPRWKELTATLPDVSSMLLFAGDDVESSREVYKNDVWMLRPMRDAEGQNMVNMLWQQGSVQGGQPGRHLPEPRRAHAGAMIPHPDEDGTQLWLIHGGKRQGGSVMGDLWQATVRWPDVSWELLDSGPEADGEEGGQGDRWRSHAPAARRGHAAVMVPGSPPRLMLFGGRSSDTKYYNDIWSWDGRDWTVQSPDSFKRGPQPRDHSSMVHNNGQLIVWGGRGGPSYASSIPLGDLWTFDLSEGTWRRRATNSRAPQPLPRWLFSYDVYTTAAERAASIGNQQNSSAIAALERGLTRHADTYLVVFGGETYEGCYLNDLWQLNLDSYEWDLLAEAKLDSRRCRSLVSQMTCQQSASNNNDHQHLAVRRGTLFLNW